MNLTAMEAGDAKRVVDFAAGLIFGLRGSIERVSNRVFLLSPADTEVVSGEPAAHRAAGLFNQSCGRAAPRPCPRASPLSTRLVPAYRTRRSRSAPPSRAGEPRCPAGGHRFESVARP
ncbi:Cell division protein SepF [Streptomyces hirsutus]